MTDFFSTKSVKMEEVSRVKPGPVKKTNLPDDRQEYIREYNKQHNKERRETNKDYYNLQAKIKQSQYKDGLLMLKELFQNISIPDEYRERVENIVCLDKYKKIYEMKKGLNPN